MFSPVLEKKTGTTNYLTRGQMTRGTIVALAVLSLVIGFVMWQRRRLAPVKQPEVAIIPAPEPLVEPMDTETYELVEAGIPEEVIDQHVAAKEASWWERNKYKAAGIGVVGTGLALGLYHHRPRRIQWPENAMDWPDTELEEITAENRPRYEQYQPRERGTWF
jgi:hypothetical protein